MLYQLVRYVHLCPIRVGNCDISELSQFLTSRHDCHDYKQKQVYDVACNYALEYHITA